MYILKLLLNVIPAGTEHLSLWRISLCQTSLPPVSSVTFSTAKHKNSKSLGLWTSSIIQNSNQLEKTTFRKLDLFPSSGEGTETPLLGLLERNPVFLSIIQHRQNPSDSIKKLHRPIKNRRCGMLTYSAVLVHYNACPNKAACT
jgi:hypothetical protein